MGACSCGSSLYTGSFSLDLFSWPPSQLHQSLICFPGAWGFFSFSLFSASPLSSLFQWCKPGREPKLRNHPDGWSRVATAQVAEMGTTLSQSRGPYGREGPAQVFLWVRWTHTCWAAWPCQKQDWYLLVFCNGVAGSSSQTLHKTLKQHPCLKWSKIQGTAWPSVGLVSVFPLPQWRQFNFHTRIVARVWGAGNTLWSRSGLWPLASVPSRWAVALIVQGLAWIRISWANLEPHVNRGKCLFVGEGRHWIAF